MVNHIVEKLKEASDAYYNSEETILDNDTYDALVETLRRLAPDHPYLKTVGAPPRGSEKVGRLIPMGTLSKYHATEHVKEWYDNESGPVIICPKYDGFGVELLYENGLLVMASTRGTGHVGEDVTAAVMHIHDVPTILPSEFSTTLTRVRGEVIIPRKNHEAVKKLGYSAMRNAVPGIVRSNNQEALMYVDFVAYEFFDGDTSRQAQRIRYKDIFNVEDYVYYREGEFDKIESDREAFGESKEHWDYECDGIVLKTDEIKEDELLRPSHQIAWKYKSNREVTILRDLQFQVGATGNIAVIGIFDEVEFQGAKLTRASIGSLQRYESLKPAIGDFIEVSRRGDIIPYIEDVVIRESDNYQECNVCPCCGHPLVDYKCVNTVCGDRVKLKLYQFIRYVGVKGIGYALLESLVDNGIVRDLSDIYKMDANVIATLPRQGRSAVTKWETLQSKELTVLDLFCAYPFENIGKATWVAMLDRFSVDEILNIDKDTLSSVKIRGLGSNKIDNLVSQMAESREELYALMRYVPLH